MIAIDVVLPKDHRARRRSGRPERESVMGVAIPSQHPPVVLRSQFNKLRALLAVALIAVAGLTVAVVILANDSDKVSSTSSAAKPLRVAQLRRLPVRQPVHRLPLGGHPAPAQQPLRGRPRQPLRSRRQVLQRSVRGRQVVRMGARGKPPAALRPRLSTRQLPPRQSGSRAAPSSSWQQGVPMGHVAVPVRQSLDAARQTSRKDRANHRPSPFGGGRLRCPRGRQSQAPRCEVLCELPGLADPRNCPASRGFLG